MWASRFRYKPRFGAWHLWIPFNSSWMDRSWQIKRRMQIAKPLNVSLIWNGSSPGAHALTVNATDLQGQTRQSQTVIVNLNTPPLSAAVAASGDTLASISQANGVSVNEVVALNPGLASQAPNDPVYPGYQVNFTLTLNPPDPE